MPREVSRASMSPLERTLRSRAAQILSSAGLLHGNLLRRLMSCGKPNCHCARGEKHEAFVLVVRNDKRTRHIPVPRRLEPEVRRWVDQERELSALVRELSRLQQEKLAAAKKRKEG